MMRNFIENYKTNVSSSYAAHYKDIYETYRNQTEGTSINKGIGLYLVSSGTLCLCGNCLVLLVYIRDKTIRNTTSLLLAALAVADIGLGVLPIPFAASSELREKWLYGYHGCMWYAFNSMLFGYASICILTLISVDRYVQMCKQHLAPDTRRRTVWTLIAVVWLCSLVFAVLPLIGWGSYGLEPTGFACIIAWWYNDISYITYIITVATVLYVVPMTTMMYCYYKVIKFMKMVGGGRNQENISWTNEKDITKMCLVCVALFFMAWTPYAILCLWTVFDTPETVPMWLAMAPALFAKTSGLYNPIIYACTCPKYRQSMYRVLKATVNCCRNKTSSEDLHQEKNNEIDLETNKTACKQYDCSSDQPESMTKLLNSKSDGQECEQNQSCLTNDKEHCPKTVVIV